MESRKRTRTKIKNVATDELLMLIKKNKLNNVKGDEECERGRAWKKKNNIIKYAFTSVTEPTVTTPQQQTKTVTDQSLVVLSLIVGSASSFAIMSFVFRGSRGDIESGFSEYVPERTLMRVHPARPVNGNSLAFLITGDVFSALWVVLAIFVMATSLRMYATCQQLQAQARAHAAAASGLLGHTELRLHMPPSIAIATRGRLQGLRLQLALLDREFDELDYDTLRALDTDTAPSTRSMTEEEINALPIHIYKIPVPPKVSAPYSTYSVKGTDF
ncbi:hypothetical protein V8G54_024681 [Vigna mungo]|uniref:RING-type E3 ubiquitin transferase n=1 Tax=Vigna mungo TaxID=3915 RepID=A0AAQ3N6U5_VIGMU